MMTPDQIANAAAERIAKIARLSPSGRHGAEFATIIREAIAQAVKRDDAMRYHHGEIEAACGGETALAVREKVMQRRARIDTEQP